jgi:hypothetical protein
LFCNFVYGGQAPKVWHPTHLDCLKEAERLCKKTGAPVYVLQVRGIVDPVPPKEPETKYTVLK